ncbi:DEAD/DEAH box helicase [Actinomycetospora lutea]|uniref:DEAD/DEAH box helicase n=1 Tax=Actinomycetospora lutea TaxID=663604 RepID=UPI002365817E|nr:DEAD/DEAH box helicase [Actinomycetospora lutea]MDD7940185.1 DEAD/DEAH box helicase [Actinomycetospora lutea]
MPTTSAPRSAAPFSDLGFPPAVVEILAARGITDPTPIQQAAIPDALSGRDVLGRGRTGSGKTLAFGLPMLARLAGGRTVSKRPRGLVLLPTRELASQVRDALAPLAEALGLRQTVVYGGVGQGRQAEALRSGVDLLIACPGRLEDLLGQGLVDLDRVEVTVLDEADHMSDLGFLPAVRRLLRRTPADGQRLLFSATLDGEVDRVVREFLHRPVTHSVDTAQEPVPDMTHHVFTVEAADRTAVVQSLAEGRGRSMLFTRTKHAARKLSRQLTAAGIPATELHGNLSQPARDRNLGGFVSGDVRVLVATDIAARGIHVDDVGLVVHVDPPAEHKAYTHRSGRTARAGSAGDVVTLVAPAERSEVASMTRKAGIKPRTATVRPGAPEITELVGEPAPRVDPEDGPQSASRKPAPQPAGGSSGGSRRGGRSGAGSGGPGGGARGSGGRGSGRGSGGEQGARGGDRAGGGGGRPRRRGGGARGAGEQAGSSLPAATSSSAGGARRRPTGGGAQAAPQHSAAAHSARAGAGRGRGRR